jgi:GntR family transcriptional regulator
MADELRRAIVDGTLGPGERLPSERELALRYGTARNTAREAVRILSEQGLVTSEHGRGSFVRRAGPLIRLGNDRYSPRHREAGVSPFLMECAQQGKEGRFEVLSVARMAPPADVAHRLQLLGSEPSVLSRENVFWADSDPVQRVTTWIPWSIAEGTALVDDEVGHPYGIHGVLEERGFVMARLSEEVGARMPTPEERGYLLLPPGVPVLDVLHTSLDREGAAYELTRFVMRADMTGLRYDAPIE